MSFVVVPRLYNQVPMDVLTDGLSVTDAKLALIADTYTFNRDHASWTTDIEPHEITGVNYDAGGKTIVVTPGPSGVGALLDAPDTVWDGLGATFAHAVMYSPSTDKVILCVTFSSGSPITTTGYDFEVSWSESGIIELIVEEPE